VIIPQKEKEDLIQKLLSERRTYRDIAKIANCSPNEIARIKKEITGENKETNEDMKSKSICSRAFDLFQKEIPVTQIVIDLDIEPEQVKKIHDSYLDLLNRQKIVSLLKDKNNMPLKIQILEFLQENPDLLAKINKAIDIQILIWEKEADLNEANNDLDNTNNLIRHAESRLQKLNGKWENR
jgi:hypothetical protein